MPQQPTTISPSLDHDAYLRLFGGRANPGNLVPPGQFLNPIMAPVPPFVGGLVNEVRRLPAQTPADDGNPATLHPIVDIPVMRLTDNVMPALYAYAMLCRAMWYGPNTSDVDSIAAAIQGEDVARAGAGTVQPGCLKWINTPSVAPATALFRLKQGGNIILVKGTHGAAQWSGQILLNDLVEDSAFRVYEDLPVPKVGAVWATWAKEIYTRIKADLPGWDASPLVLTGHSMGGVVAQYVAMLILKEKGAGFAKSYVTFGAPRAGDRNLDLHVHRAWVDKSWYPFRVCNWDDPTPAVPPWTPLARWQHTIAKKVCLCRTGGVYESGSMFENPGNFPRELVQGNTPVGIGWQTIGLIVNQTPTAGYDRLISRYQDLLTGTIPVNPHKLKVACQRMSWFVAKAIFDGNHRMANMQALYRYAREHLDPIE